MASTTVPPAIIKKAYIDSPLLEKASSRGAQLHYRYAAPSTPTTKPPFLLLHKSASSSESYTSIINILVSRGHACFAPDMPGFGNSTPPNFEPGTVKTTWYCEVFAEMATSLGLLGPQATTGFHIIGHHSGAALGLELATMYPSSVRSLTLVGPTVMPASERAAMNASLTHAFNKPQPDGSHLQITWDYLIKSGVGESLELRQREALDHIYAWVGRLQIYGAVWEQPSDELFKKLTCKTLALCAPDDVLFKFFPLLKEYRPDDGVMAKECKGGNFSLDRDPEGIMELVLGMVDEVDA